MSLKEMKNESGFTLIELLVVILIIGILAAIAVPVFLNQRKKGITASVQSDLKNAALVMESEMANNQQKYLSYVPNYNPRSNGVKVSLDLASSSSNQYCLMGVSETYPEIKFYYDSTRGGVLKSTESCTPLSGGSFTSVLATKKALIIGTWGYSSPGTLPKKFLLDKGFGTVDIKSNPPVAEYAGYDLIVALGSNGTMNRATYDNLLIGYNQGYKILTDGNDADPSTMPFITKRKTISTGMSAEYNKTGNGGLSPAFPYTYTEPAFVTDSHWVCTTEMNTDMVTLATSPGILPADPVCITAAAMTTGQGRWVHLLDAPMQKQNGVVASSIDWLMM